MHSDDGDNVKDSVIGHQHALELISEEDVESKLKFDAAVPTVLQRLYKRLSQKIELLSYTFNTITCHQLSSGRGQVSWAYGVFSEVIYNIYEKLVCECEVCRKVLRPQPRPKICGIVQLISLEMLSSLIMSKSRWEMRSTSFSSSLTAHQLFSGFKPNKQGQKK
eukprot:114041-Amphidinium_carterae.1